MTVINLTRRDFITCAVGAAVWHAQKALILAQGRGGRGEQAGPLIRLVLDKAGSRPYWTPVGLYIQKGQKVRWRAAGITATVTAFHPSNDNHELRIPESAKPFDSGPFRGEFEWTFDVEGTYDYYSRGLEVIGTVGRIVVGNPGGPGEQPVGYASREGRAPVFPAQVKALAMASSKEIVAKKVVPFDPDTLMHPYPYLAPRDQVQ